MLEKIVQRCRMIDHRLRVLQVVADRGTISAAAADLGYTPSAVSHQLRTLARDLGVRLLEPDVCWSSARISSQRASSSPPRLSRVLARWEEIRAELQQTSGANLGRLRLAGFSTAASALLPVVATAAMREFPLASVRIVEADPEVCFEMLLVDRVDLAVVVATDRLPPSDDLRFEQHPLMEDELDLLVPAGHRLAPRPSVSLAEAAAEPWIMDRPGRPYHQLVTGACAAAGFTPRQAHEVTEWDTGAALVAAGLGVALVPRLVRLPADEVLVRVPVRGDAGPTRYIRTSIRRGTAGQPEIAFALGELERLARLMDTSGRPG
jgi:DNA-binding transcriptional LysR family regulator